MKNFIGNLIGIFLMSTVAEAQVQYQYVPNSPPWPQVEHTEKTPLTSCITINSQQFGDQHYPIASTTTCN